MKAGSVYGSYLKASDLAGRKVPVKIAAAEVVDYDDGKKIALSFVGKDKKFTVNLTNSNTITEILGSDETDEWIGHMIVLKPDRTMFGAKMVDCIRVEAYIPPQPGRPAPPPPPPPPDEHFVATDDDVPF